VCRAKRLLSRLRAYHRKENPGAGRELAAQIRSTGADDAATIFATDSKLLLCHGLLGRGWQRIELRSRWVRSVNYGARAEVVCWQAGCQWLVAVWYWRQGPVPRPQVNSRSVGYQPLYLRLPLVRRCRPILLVHVPEWGDHLLTNVMGRRVEMVAGRTLLPACILSELGGGILYYGSPRSYSEHIHPAMPDRSPGRSAG